MPSGIQWDPVVQQELAMRGVDKSTGVYGDHKVQIGKGSPLRLDEIKSASMPYAGFTQVKKIERGKAGIASGAESTLKTLCSRAGTLDAKTLLGTLKAMQTQTDRLAALGQLTQAQKQDTMWTFTAAVQGLSNRELSAAYQSFLTAEMDLLQTALQHEGQNNPNAVDARRAAAQLFDLQALILKEISNRSVNEQIDQTMAGEGQKVDGVVFTLDDIAVIDGQEQILEGRAPDEDSGRPKSLVSQFGGTGSVDNHAEAHDISAANLVSLTEIGARSATQREKTAVQEQSKLSARGIDDVTVREIGDALRKCEVTMNIKTGFLIGGENNIFDHLNDPMVNIFHLHDQGNAPKGADYLEERATTEEVLFPELKGRQVNADERPMYAAVNYRQNRLGAITTRSDYGASVIVLKPEAAKRATYSVNDSFMSTKLDFSQARRQNFYNLLDGVNESDHLRFGGTIPESLVSALRDPNSQEHRDFDAYLDKLATLPKQKQETLQLGYNSYPESIQAHFPGEDKDANLSSFKAFLTECFADMGATRSAMATHDNLETLITQMDSVSGNNLARAVKDGREGESPRLGLSGVQYIEAQVHGPLIPSRDIAEIRINLDDVPENQQEDVKARARQYEKDTGIKVTFTTYVMEQEDEDEMTDVVEDKQRAFNAQHLDQAELAGTRKDYMDHLDEKLGSMIAFYTETLQAGLPAGALRIEGNAREKLKADFNRRINEIASESHNYTARDVVMQAFRDVALPALQQKAALLRELETIAAEEPPLLPAQKQAVAKWVVEAGALRSPLELRTIVKHARMQADLFREIASAEPPMTTAQVLQRFAETTRALDQDLITLVQSLNDPDFGTENRFTEQDRVGFMSLALLKAGEPPVDQEGLKKLHGILCGREMSHAMAQMQRVENDPAVQEVPERGRVYFMRMQLHLNACNVAKEVGEHFRDPAPYRMELSLLQEPVRAGIRQVAPQVGQILDAQHPAYAPMPAPAHPELLPQNAAQRRGFCVQVLDNYTEIEKVHEKGQSTHGRGHIARSYIYATVMCNMLEEAGIKVDKNAVQLSIAGHDMGRQGPGYDKWEQDSATKTVGAMQNTYGPDAMGPEYEQHIAGCIIHTSPQNNTVEAMVMQAADSLDIGRTKDFDLERFPFLKGKPGETPSQAAEDLRKELAKEADQLQRMTNPYCANRNALHKMNTNMLEASDDLADEFNEQAKELRKYIADEFAKDWDVPSEEYMTRYEDIIHQNPQLFPLLSKYYH